MSSVPTWKNNRKIMNLAFTQQVLNGFISVFNSQSQRLTKQFEENPERTFEPHTMLLTNNLETICSKLFLGSFLYFYLLSSLVCTRILLIKFDPLPGFQLNHKFVGTHISINHIAIFRWYEADLTLAVEDGYKNSATKKNNPIECELV